MTDITGATADDDSAALKKQLIDGAWRIDVLADTLGQKKDAAGLRALLDVGLLDAENVRYIGKIRYRAIAPILKDCSERCTELIADWLRATYRAQPELASRMLCELIHQVANEISSVKPDEKFSAVKKAYKLCADIGMDMHRVIDMPLSQRGQIAAGEEVMLSRCTPYATLMCELPPYDITAMIQDGTLAPLDHIPIAGEMAVGDGKFRRLNLLEYFGFYHAGNGRNDDLISLLDKESTIVRHALADSIVTLVKEFGLISKNWPPQTPVKIAAMINAGADLDRLADGMAAIEVEPGGTKRNIFHILAGANYTFLTGLAGQRQEYLMTAIEALTQKVTPEQSRRFELDISADDGTGQTPLHLAAKNAATVAVDKLLHAGANYNARTPHGIGPEDVAREAGREDVVAMIQSWSARQAIQAALHRARPQP